MNEQELFEGAKRVRRLNDILKDLTIPELEYLYDAIPAIIEFNKKTRRGMA